MKFREFDLDAFQEDAINSIDENHSVIVSAPTGSGKTLIADYIIDKDIQDGKRVIYTGPIKALSNQKYKDFVKQYGDDKIGLITGDTVINSRAQVLIMTTEIYRNMAVIKDEVLNDVSYVIFDEIHFINDEERGYIWEESIIFSPEHIRFLFLSATIPNADEFAQWVKSIKHHDVISIRHDERPVPLEIMFYDTELGIAPLDKVKDAASIPDYHRARGRRSHRGERHHQQMRPPDYLHLISDLQQLEKLPCIYFVFSRAKTQKYALRLAQAQNFIQNEERAMLSKHIAVEFNGISKEVASLRSTSELRSCLSKGVAFHHAGMLPDVKHIVEKLFGLGLVKILFATETFAVGINMPAKTVCFDSLRKFTGTGFRYVNSKEFFQISGRAGRRGIDKSGLSVSMIQRAGADFRRIKEFTSRDTEPIKSQFKLTYNTVLNMINLHSPDEIEHILTLNFYTFQQGGRASVIKARYDNIVRELYDLGYIAEGALTEKGIFATKIFSFEIEITEAFNSHLALEEYEMLMLLGSLIYEERRDVEFFRRFPDKRIHALQRALKAHPVLRKGKWFEHMNDLTSVLEPVNRREKFIDILRNCTIPEGDLIRFFMQLLDKLEQVDRATTDLELQAKVRNCKDRIRDTLEGIHVF